MTFFPMPDIEKPKGKGKVDFQLLYQLQCRACPLQQLHNKHPKMKPTGSDKPLIYCLGEAPGEDEDEDNEQFVGRSGALLRSRIPKRFLKLIRWNNCVRTRPHENGANRTPTPIELACCRPSVQNDIEDTRPKAIFGFGNVPLQWVTGYTGIQAYRGRRMPVQIGNHVCWYYPMLHPAFLLRQGKRRMFNDIDDTAIGSEMERMFVFDLERALYEIQELPDAEIHTAEQALSGFDLILQFTDQSLDRIEKELQWYSVQDVIGVDYETDSKSLAFSRPYGEGTRILSAAVATGKRGLGIPFDHPGAEWSKKQRKRLQEIWYNFLYTCKARKAVHNLTFEQEWTGHFFGKELIRRGQWEDTATQASKLDERSRGCKPGPLSLEFLVLQYFGLNIKKLAGVNRGSLIDTPLPHVLQYNCLDSKYHCLLYKEQDKRLIAEGLQTVYELALRKVPTMVLTQMKGLPVSQEYLQELKDKYEKRINVTMKKIARHEDAIAFKKRFHRDYNPLAAKDGIDLFGTMLGHEEVTQEVAGKENARALEEGREARDERMTANKNVLKLLPGDLPKYTLTVREANKRLATYISRLMPDHPETYLFPDNLLHPQFNLLFAVTGRVSAEWPPVQQWPKRDGEAKEVRKPFVPEKGKVILAIDYGQIEARVIAMYTKDKRFVKALWERYDIHGEWAERIAHQIPSRIGGKKFLKDKKVMKDFRTDIKNQWTFPLVFGASLQSVAGYLKVDESDLKPCYDEFWDEFDGIRRWQKDLLAFYHEHGYVETFTGLRRRGPLSINKVYNSPVQGVTAEIVMDAMCRLSETGDDVMQPELQIHDDLTFMRIPEKKVDYYMEKILDIMIHPPFDFINVPIAVEASIGDNWYDMDEVGVFSSDEWDAPITKRKQA